MTDVTDTGRLELPQGTLDLLILKALSLEAQHGWAISERIRQVSAAALQIPQGSLYPALHRLERGGWVKARRGAADKKPRGEFFNLTRPGGRPLETDTGSWERV